MDTKKIEKRRSFLINIIFWMAVAAILYVLLVKALPIVLPFFIAFVIALILNKPSFKIHQKFPKIKKSAAGRILFLIVLIIIALIIAFAGVSIASYIKDFAKWLGANFKHIPGYLLGLKTKVLDATASLPDSIRGAVENALNKYASTDAIKSIDVSKILTGAAGGVWSFAKGVPSVLVSTLIAIIATFFMFGAYDDIVLFIRAQLPERGRTMLSDVKSAFKDTIGKYALAYGKIILITFGEILVSLLLMKLFKIYKGSYIPLIAAGIAIVDILPVLGTGSIVAPWAVICFVQGDIAMGIALLVMWGVISVIRQYIEPKLVGKQIGLNPVLTLFGMYVGLKVFGAIGMFGLPITIIVLKALQDTGKIHLWKTPEEVGLREPKSEETPETKPLLQKVFSKKKGKEEK
ncbi:MAG: sporulation integral membrane protein YtvI [Clostridia bacterium]|nr:sporulation integral membrane protein YtvI [Clostridia bacterium]